jgi:hypothetical protein
MAFKYEQAVPWGRSFDDYVRMFALSGEDFAGSILGVADGPASFNAGMARRGRRVVSCDPLYQFSAAQIRQRIKATYQQVIGQTRENQDKFVWEQIKTVDELASARLGAMREFLDDYDAGRSEGRYLTAELPDLPLRSGSFDLALCSHFLFFYWDSFSLESHLRAADQLCCVAKEVRLFPLLTYNADPSPFVTPVASHLLKRGRKVSVEKVDYEFQRGGNMMMRILPGS